MGSLGCFNGPEISLLGSLAELQLLPTTGFLSTSVKFGQARFEGFNFKIASSGIFSEAEEIVDSLYKIHQGFKKMTSENINEAQLKVMQNMEELVIDTYNRWVGYTQV